MARKIDSWLAVVAMVLLVVVGTPANAYDRDVHYYVNLLMALDRGFSLPEAVELATLAQYTDDAPQSGPTKAASAAADHQRRTYHFPCDSGYFAEKTRRDSPFARHQVNQALRENDRIKLAVAIHVYADSWSHESYGDVFGHTSAIFNPDRVHRNVDKFMEMYRSVQTILDWYRDQNHLPLVGPRVTEAELRAAAGFVPSSTAWCDQGNYERLEIEPRCATWQALIKTKFGEAAAHQIYADPAGPLRDRFNAVIGGYRLPTVAQDCDNTHWNSPRQAAALPAGVRFPAITALLQAGRFPLPVAGAPDNDQLLAILTGSSVTEVARYLVAHPELITDERIKALIVSETGLEALMQLARSRETLPVVQHLILACDWTAVAQVANAARNLQSTNFHIRLLAANLLLQREAATPESEAQIAKFYGSLELARLSETETLCLLDTMVLDEEFVAPHAAVIIALLDPLLEDDRFASLAAAKLYQIGSEETPAVKPVPGEEDLRQLAFDHLRQGNPARLQHPDALRYWQIRSYEDFNDAVNDRATDRANLVKLIDYLDQAVGSREVDLIHAAAAALSTYRAADHPDQALLDTLVQDLAAAPEESKWQIGYAIEQLTGATFDLTPTGLAEFDRQWRRRSAAKPNRPHEP